MDSTRPHRPPQPHIPPLAIVLPKPTLPRRASLRSSIASPRTPRNLHSPVLFANQPNRTSTDSWNSSSGAAEDDLQWEWKQEQVSFIIKTLDALPAHLLTPFYGSAPPSNLIDKLSKGMIHAKGPLEWPHSLRATRAKLVDVIRERDAEDEPGHARSRLPTQELRRKAIAEEEELGIPHPVPGHPLQSSLNTRALCRQSSMDFLQGASLGVQTRSRSRLQRLNKACENTSYHPYSRPTSRSPSPSGRPARPVSYTGSYRSSGGSSISSYTRLSPMPIHGYPLRRTVTDSSASARRSLDASSITTDRLAGLKRAPSFSGLSTSSGRVSLQSVGCYNPADEVEKPGRKAKRARRGSRSSSPSDGEPSTALSATHSTSSSSTARSSSTIVPRGKKDKKVPVPVPIVPDSFSRSRTRRNSSMFGAELRGFANQSAAAAPQPNLTRPATPPPPPTTTSTATVSTTQPPMQTSSPRALRRVKGLPIGPNLSPTRSRPAALRTPARRISFGSLKEDSSSSRVSHAKGFGLASAFQMN